MSNITVKNENGSPVPYRGSQSMNELEPFRAARDFFGGIRSARWRRSGRVAKERSRSRLRSR